MRHAILLEDDDGVSFFEDRDAELPLKYFAPPARPLYISDPLAANGSGHASSAEGGVPAMMVITRLA